MPGAGSTGRGGWRQWLLGLLWAQAAWFPASAQAPQAPQVMDDPSQALRERMVERQLAGRGIDDARVLAAMARVPRHLFVPEAAAAQAYLDQPLPIGHDQTISQPYIVALMTQLARVGPEDRVLEVGTGSGYQAAVLGEIAGAVYTIEIVAPLAGQAARVLEELGYARVRVRTGDGYAGWPEHAPYDAILVTAAPERVPAPLLAQLRPGGRLVIPVGPVHAVQELRVIEKQDNGRLRERVVSPVRFVPLTGQAADRDRGGR